MAVLPQLLCRCQGNRLDHGFGFAVVIMILIVIGLPFALAIVAVIAFAAAFAIRFAGVVVATAMGTADVIHEHGTHAIFFLVDVAAVAVIAANAADLAFLAAAVLAVRVVQYSHSKIRFGRRSITIDTSRRVLHRSGSYYICYC